MPYGHSRRRRLILWASAAAVLVLAACLIVAAPQREPMREEVMLDGAPVVVDYSPTASADDVKLPFLPGTTLETGLTYSVTTKAGEHVTSYARAVLTSPDPPGRVAQAYSQMLPGNPQPEVIEDKAGTRHVLALGSDAEVRTVTITAQGGGSRIELVRALGLTIPRQPFRPGSRDQQVI